MSWAERKKKFFRWYFGEWVNDPTSDVIMFGLMPSRGARRLRRIVRWLGIRLA